MRLIEYYPERHYGGAVEDMVNAMQPALDQLADAYTEFAAQLFVSTATWGLDAWETALGITSGRTRPLNVRRERIKSRLRGAGTTTKEMMENVVESFARADCTIIEHPGNYSFDIEFTGLIGRPDDLAALSASIDEIKPAHLSYTYIFRYRTHAELSLFTHRQLAEFTHKTLREGALV